MADDFEVIDDSEPEAPELPPVILDYASGPSAGAGPPPLPPTAQYAATFACPVCGYRGSVIRKQAGSPNAALMILLFLTILGGIFYYLIYCRDIFACPRCGFKVGDAS